MKSKSSTPRNRNRSVREAKIRAALEAAMRRARGEPEPTNPALQLALARARLAPRKNAQPPEGNPDKKESASPAQRRAGSNGATGPVLQPSTKKRQKRKLTPEEKEQARLIAERNRLAKEKRKREAAARRRAAAEEAAKRERIRREAEKLIEIEQFVANIEASPFAELLQCWRKHVELIDYIRRTGKNRHRLELYERLVRSIEIEWKRRSSLRHSADEYFDWPTTKAKRGNGSIGDLSWVEQGVLGYLGYHVGESSELTTAHRQAILRRVFHMHLPPIEGPAYMAEWGKPDTPARLKKMANSIASFARQAKRQRSRDMTEAVECWERDLKMLHDEYYVGKFGFGWPTT